MKGCVLKFGWNRRKCSESRYFLVIHKWDGANFKIKSTFLTSSQNKIHGWQKVKLKVTLSAQ